MVLVQEKDHQGRREKRANLGSSFLEYVCTTAVPRLGWSHLCQIFRRPVTKGTSRSCEDDPSKGVRRETLIHRRTRTKLSASATLRYTPRISSLFDLRTIRLLPRANHASSTGNRAYLETLEDGRVLGISRNHVHPILFKERQHRGSAGDESFLVCKRNGLLLLDSLNRWQ